MRNKRLYMTAVLLTASVLLFAGCGSKAEPASAQPASEEPASEEAGEEMGDTSENGYPIDQTSGTGDTSGEIVEAEKPVGQDGNGSDVAGMDNPDGMTDDEINAEIIDEADSIEASDFEIIPMDDSTMYCTANSANIRKGPNTDYEKAGTLSYAQEIIVNGKVETADSTWYVIKTESSDDIQMVSGSLLSTTKPQPQQTTSQPSSGNTNNTGTTQQPSGGGQPSGGNGDVIVDGGGAPAHEEESIDWGDIDKSWGGLQ